MPNNKVRIVLDTNLWISFLITHDYSKLDALLFSEKIILVFSQELLAEFLEVAKRAKFRKYFSKEDIENILETINEYADLAEVHTKTDACRDSKDNFLLSLSKDGNVDYLLTGDKDLLELKQFERTKILTIKEFYQIFNPNK